MKHGIFLKISSLALSIAMALGVGVVAANMDIEPVKAAETVYKTTEFTSTNNNAGTNSYTSTFTNTTDGFTVTVANGNNNNNGWEGHVRFGRKSAASIGAIYTESSIDKAITKVDITTGSKAGQINNIKVYAGDSKNPSSTVVGSMTSGFGPSTVLSITLSNTKVNQYYRVAFDMATGSNGAFDVGKVEFYADGGSAVVTYTITYNLDDGTLPEGSKYAIGEGESYTLPIPTKPGYDFAGWFENESLTGNSITSVDGTKNVTVYAKWTEKEIKNGIYTLTIGTSYFNSSSYANNNTEKTVNAIHAEDDTAFYPVTWVSNQIMLQSGNMQWQKNTGYLYNTTDLGTILSVTVTSTEGTFTTTYGSIEQPTGETVGGGFFKIAVGSATGKTTEIVIEFRIGPAPALDVIELTGGPTEDIYVNESGQLGYYGLDVNGDEWTGDVTYVSSDSTVVAIEGNTYTALQAGTAQLSVYANAGVDSAKVESEKVAVTVIPEPTRQELPVGNYQVVISANGLTEGSETRPEPSYEIKAKEGDNWYQNLSVSYTDIEVKYDNEYTITAGGNLTITNNSNAVITSVSIDWYGSNVSTMTVESDVIIGTAGTSSSNYKSSVLNYSVNSTTGFVLTNTTETGTHSFYTLTINLEVIDNTEELCGIELRGTPKTNYYEGSKPSNDGLTVYALYSRDGGETISREEEVTSLVEWSYNVETITKETDSYTITVTFNSTYTDDLEVTGITVSEYPGVLANGQHYISHTRDGVTYYLAQNGSSAPMAVTNYSEATLFTFTKIGENTYTISAEIESETNYLYSTTSNNGVRFGNPQDSSIEWTIEYKSDDTEDKKSGEFNLINKGYTRYLSMYDKGEGVFDFRTYTDKDTANRKEATDISTPVTAWSNEYMHMNDAAYIGEGTGACKGEVYINAKKALLALGTEFVLLFQTDDKYNDIQLRYEKWAKANGDTTPYAGEGIVLARNNFLGISNNETSVMLIVVMSSISLLSFSCFLFLRKRKEQQ